MVQQSFMPFFAPFGWLAVMLLTGVILRAKVGFFIASLVGMPLANWGVRKGLTTAKTGALSQDILKGLNPNFTSPAAAELGLYNAFALVLLPLTLVIFPLPQMNVSILFVVLTGYALAAVAGLKLFGFWKARCW
jgi:hypothetical protein